MKAKSETMFVKTRRKAILDLVAQRGFITVRELCDQFGVSPATIRQDLRQLDLTGKLERMHGGAISPDKAIYEPNTYQKEIRNRRQKEAIARAALARIRTGDTLALDTGTTTFELAKLMPGIGGLTVVTYDLQIAAWLESNTDATVILAGGQVRRNFHCTAGQSVIETISRLHVDKTFTAANGLSAAHGLSTPNVDMANIKSALVACAEQVILLCDSSKLGHDAFVSFAPLNSIDVLITDPDADPALLEEIRNLGVTVQLAPG